MRHWKVEESLGDTRIFSEPGYWVLFLRDGSGKRPFTVRRYGAEVLPLFSFGEEASLFTRYGLPNFAREVDSERKLYDDITALLLDGDLRDTEYVALDPLPEMLDDRTFGLVTVRRERFLANIMQRESGGGSSMAGKFRLRLRNHTHTPYSF